MKKSVISGRLMMWAALKNHKIIFSNRGIIPHTIVRSINNEISVAIKKIEAPKEKKNNSQRIRYANLCIKQMMNKQNRKKITQ